MTPLEKIVRPIVEGQVRGFLKEHPKIVEAVDWYKPRKDKAETFTNSLAKRIVRDLVCVESELRIRAALLESSPGAPSNSAGGILNCGEDGRLGTTAEPTGAAQ